MVLTMQIWGLAWPVWFIHILHFRGLFTGEQPKQPKKEDLPQENTKNIQAGNCIKTFESGIVTLSKKKILDLKK